MKFLLIIISLLSINQRLYSQWSDVDSGTNSGTYALYVDTTSDLLYVGGLFNTAGGININSIATWDGTNWNSFGNNAAFSSPGVIFSILKFNGEIVVAGKFEFIGSTRVNNIAKWNGISWEAFGNGFDDTVSEIIVYDGELYACGYFFYSGTDTVRCFAKWNGTKWVTLTHLIGYAITMTEFNGKLIVGGGFTHATLTCSAIIGWDGVNEDTTIGYFSGTIIKLRNIKDTLYAVGEFTSIPINPSNYISVYYNQSWHSIGNPIGGQNSVVDVCKYNDRLYFCGYFTNPPDLCRYNGSGYDSVADVLGYIDDLIEYKNELYAAGLFTQLNGASMYHIARYNETNNTLSELRNEKDYGVKVYPNPSSTHKIKLNFNNIYLQRNIEISVITLKNELVQKKVFTINDNDVIEVSIPDYRGVVILKIIIDSKEVIYEKIILL
jgi:hypothetical protein